MKLNITGALLFCCLSLMACISTKTPKTSSSPVKEESKIPLPPPKSPYSPGTVGLEFTIKSIDSQGPSILINAKVLSVLGYGAGITQVYSTGDQISFPVAKERKINFSLTSPMKAVFSLQQEMGASKAKLMYQKSINH